MKIQAKIHLGYIVLFILLFFVSAFFYWQQVRMAVPLSESIPNSLQEKEYTNRKTQYFLKLDNKTLQAQKSLDNFIYSGDQKWLKSYYLHRDYFEKCFSYIQKFETKERRRVIETYYVRLVEKNAQILDAALSKQKNAAVHIRESALYHQLETQFQNEIKELYHESRFSIDERATINVYKAAKQARTILSQTTHASYGVFFLSITFILLTSWLARRSLTVPLKHFRDNILSIKDKSLSVSIEPSLIKMDDEIGEVSRAFVALQDKLKSSTVARDELQSEVDYRKLVEANLLKSNKHLEQLNKELEQFAYAASHDLKTPVQGIRNLISWIEEDYGDKLPEEVDNYFSLIKQRSERLEQLITGLLNYAREGSQKEQIDIVNLSGFLAKLRDDFPPVYKEAIQFDPNLPEITAPIVPLRQVLFNLIDNALKYNDKQNPFVYIKLDATPTHYIFRVQDNGPGVEAKYHHKIFEIFQKLDEREDVQSSGIGLALVKKIVNRYDGQIKVTSKVGHGATFEFTWPKMCRVDEA